MGSCIRVSAWLRPVSYRPRKSTHYVDTETGSEEPEQTSTRDFKPKRVVDEATKATLVSNLRETLFLIDRQLLLHDADLVSQLEEVDYNVAYAASEFIERSGLRQIEPNSTLKQVRAEDDTPNVKNAWSPCEPSVFRVRAGPNYRKTKLKAQAKAPPLYDCIAYDVYVSDSKVEHLSRFMKLGDLENTGEDLALPQLFIINFMLPLEEPKIPSMFGPQPEPDGPTICFHTILRIGQWTKENLTHPSVELLAKFLRESGDGQSMRERLKIIVQVANPDELDMNRVERGIYKQFNGLPFLFRTYNSTYKRGNGWFQADFDGHRSGYTTRLSRYALLGLCNRILANAAFLVEAETDEEMPERILGCHNVHRIQVDNAKRFVKPVATPLSPSSKAMIRNRTIGLPLQLDSDALANDVQLI